LLQTTNHKNKAHITRYNNKEKLNIAMKLTLKNFTI